MNRSVRLRGLARAARTGAKRLEELRRAASSTPAADTAPESASISTFLRGLALGALVGAAIAGSTIWERRHRRAHREPPDWTLRPDRPMEGDAATE